MGIERKTMILDQNECWYRRNDQKLPDMFWLPGYMTQWQSNVTQNTREAGRICQSWHFTINSKHYLCYVDNYSNFLVMKQVDGYSTHNLIKACKIMISEYGLPSKIVSDVGTNFISKIWEFLLKAWHLPCSILIIQPPEQWTSRTMH